jgi:hypothetical protein
MRKDVPGSSRGHVTAEEIGELGERRDVEVDHIHGALDRDFQKVAVQAVSGIVHQDIDRHRLRVETAFQPAGRAGRGKIDRLDHHIDPYLLRRSEASFSIGSSLRAANTRLTFCAAKSRLYPHLGKRPFRRCGRDVA